MARAAPAGRAALSAAAAAAPASAPARAVAADPPADILWNRIMDIVRPMDGVQGADAAGDFRKRLPRQVACNATSSAGAQATAPQTRTAP
jgi:hypothetical protein